MQNRIQEEVKARFWRKTCSAMGCLNWTASTNRGGYGQFNAGSNRIVLAHRFAWETTYGEIRNGLLVCHHCDNRLCVKPEHLFLGTYTDNNRDMFAKGRGHLLDGSQIIGSSNKMAKLTDRKAGEIKYLLSAGASLSYLSERYEVTKAAIKCISDGITWRNIEPISVPIEGDISKERPSGERNANAKMTWEKVEALRKSRRDGTSAAMLAAQYGISLSTVKQILRGATWTHGVVTKVDTDTAVLPSATGWK